ncbi:V-type proton ATPase subunit S1 [Amphibalanus amphitrite]|uniref:V-type proton ATPase subunit S1 n=1 Tax=Amphibalanus amphitrite TaxID=1232801 RepID=A0A6A4VPM3_AMPAM|nr:V-type proton ATPase subunit S1 [Amphibalanus amphitrite]
MLAKSVLLLLLLLLAPSCAHVGTPVLLWKSSSGRGDLTLPDLQRASPTEEVSQFYQFLNAMESELLVIFLMNELNVEDFSGYPDALSQLQSEFESSEHVFAPSMPSVEMERLTSFQIINVSASGPSAIRLGDSITKTLLLVNLKDRSAADRREALLQVDDAIEHVLEQVRRLTDNYVAMLTGRYTSIGEDIESRSSRSLKASTPDKAPDKPTTPHHLFLNLGCILLYTSDSPVIHFMSMKAATSQHPLLLPLGSPSSNASSCNGSDVNSAIIVWQHANSSSVDLAGVTLNLTFRANMTRPGGTDVSFWTLSEVTLSYAGNVDDKAISKAVVTLDFDDVYAPRHFSYHCTSRMWAAEPSANATDNDAPVLTAIQLPGFQVQAFLAEGAKARFGRAWDCTTFFTIPILSGLFVTLLMLLILIISVKMLMNVPTMDRFDDPHGPLLMAHLPLASE